MLAAQPRGHEAHYAINRYLRERGDAKFKNLEDMLAMPMFSGSLDNLKRAFSDDAETLDTRHRWIILCGCRPCGRSFFK
jgi:hypothetical protein